MQARIQPASSQVYFYQKTRYIRITKSYRLQRRVWASRILWRRAA